MIKISSLSNGIRVVTDEIASVESVTLGMWVGVGTRYEPAEINGVSHFLEHMAFKGTERRSARAIAEEIEAVGGYLNAYTSREMTAYHARLLASDIPLAMDILSDILQNSIFDDEEFQKERNVILQEILESLDTPDDIVFDYFQALAFPEQPLGRPVLGTAEIINGLTPHTVRRYMQEYYAPNRMIFAAAGKVAHEDILTRAEKLLGSWKAISAQTASHGRYQGGVKCYTKALEQTQWLLGFEGISQKDPLYYAAAVLSMILGGGMSSRLFQEIREKRGLAYTIYSYHSCYLDTGLFGIYASTSHKDVLTLTEVILEELRRFPETLKDDEITKAQAQLKAGTLMGLESTTTRCERAANQVHLFGRIIPPSEAMEKIDAVTRQDLVLLSEKLFSGRPTLVTLGPKDKTEKLSELVA